jgi:uncharacterized repeat protein (TIGR03806 family)
MMAHRFLSFALLALLVPGCHKSSGSAPPWGYDVRPSNGACLAHVRPPNAAGVALAPAFDGLTFNQPVDLLQRPGDDTHWYLVQQDGIVKLFANDDTTTTTTNFLDIHTEIDQGGAGEGGLLSIAFDPQFDTNHEVFVSYTGPGAGEIKSHIGSFTSADGLTATGPEVPVFSLQQPYANHNGGNIMFGPDGYLYVGFGDGGSQGDPDDRVQDLGQFFGKMLRIDPDGGSPYAVPADNPFLQTAGALPEIWAFGFRNPWRWSFDQDTGEMWVGDVGQDTWEEVDHVEKGGNYGWSLKEAYACYKAPSPCDTGPWTDPIAAYNHTDGNSITGGFVYRGTEIPSLVGTYVYADFGSGTVWGLFYDPVTGDPQPQVLLPTTGIGFSSFAQGNDGEIYLLDYNAGKILKLVAAGTPPPDDFPKTLSTTGCVDPSSPSKAAAGMIPYDVNAPLWSDGATKRRWMSVPDGLAVHVNTNGDFDYPVGTVLMKEFSVGGKRAETRLLMYASDGWSGYSYEWNDAQTEATLLPSNLSKPFGSQDWFYPSRSECLACHTLAAGRSLGPEVLQLNRNFKYPDGATVNQLAQLQHIGMFDADIGYPPSLPALPSPTGSTGSVEDRARAYMHANCSICHRPQGTNQANFDARFGTSFHDSGLCNGTPLEGDLGATGAKLLVPGDPSHSLISLRIHANDSNRMPPVGRHVVDTQGAALIDQWISSLTACP